MRTIHFGETGDFVSKDAIWGQFLTDRDRSAYGRSSWSRNGVRGDQGPPPQVAGLRFPQAGLCPALRGSLTLSELARLLKVLGVQFSHATGAEGGHDFVGPEFCSCRQSHFFLSSAVQLRTRVRGGEPTLGGRDRRKRFPSGVTSKSWPADATLDPGKRGRTFSTCNSSPFVLTSAASN